MTAYSDLADLPEDERIEIIGTTAEGGALAGFIVEDNAKADRYLDKLKTRHKVRVVDRCAGPVPGSVIVTVGPVES